MRQRAAPPCDHASAISAAVRATASQSGGPGIRQSGSHRACDATTPRENTSSHAASSPGSGQPVRIAANPAGTAAPIAGTISAFAVSPEIETRWK
jgi:hypothetical protein